MEAWTGRATRLSVVAREELPKTIGFWARRGFTQTDRRSPYVELALRLPKVHQVATPEEMREIQDWIIKYQLQTVSGVTEVLSLGGFEKQYQVRLDPDALLAYDIQIGDVIGALERGNKTEGAQFLEIGAEQYTVRGVGLARSVDDLAEIVVNVDDGRPVRVRDLGEIVIGGGVRQGLATANGQGEVVAGLVLKLYGTNT